MTTAAAQPPAPAEAPQGEPRRSGKTLRAGIVGAGSIARQHLACLRETPAAEIACVCDLSPAMAEAAADRFGVPAWSTDHRAMLRDHGVNVVHVVTPPGSHYAIARDAIDAGAHVLVEKPIVLERPQLDDLLARAAAKGVVVQESHNYQFNRPVQRILDLVATGEFGAPVQVEVAMCLDILGGRFADPNAPSPLLEAPGGVMIDFLTHLAYLAHIFLGPGRAVRTAFAKRDPSTILPHDEFRALVEHERGLSTLAFSAHAKPDLFWLRVHGERMRASVSIFEGRLTVEKIRSGPKPLIPTFNALADATGALGNAFGSLSRKLSGGPGAYEGLWRMIKLLYASLASGAQPPVPIAQIREVADLVDALAAPENRL